MSKRIKDNEYICLSAVLRAKEARLLNKSQLDRMLSEREFSDACRVAAEGGYEDMSGMDVNGVNAALARYRAGEVGEISEMVPDPMVLNLFRMKYDYHNAKVLVKSGGDLEKNKHLISDSARFSAEKLLEVYQAEEGNGGLPRGCADAIRDARNALARTGNPQLADFILDKAYFAELLAEAAKSKKTYITDYVRMQIDQANLRSVIRTAGMAHREELLDKALIEGGTIGVAELIEAAESKERLVDLYASTELAKAAATADLSLFEREADKAMQEYMLRVNYVPFGPEVLMEYLSALEYEITALRIILTGKLMGLPEAKLRERLRDRYV